MKNLILPFFGALLMSSVALAMAPKPAVPDSNGGPDQKPVPGSIVLSFEDFKEACTNPSKFHNQIAPTNIQISCGDSELKWVPDTDGTENMDTGRQITVDLTSDKYMTSTMTGTVDSAPDVVTCPRFKQVAETVSAIQAATCDQLVAFKGNAIDYCTGVIDNLRRSNPASVISKETGQKLDLCEDNSGGRGQH
jgi:hypothetical protein